MAVHTEKHPPCTAFREIRIDSTTYRVTSVFSGEKDLGQTLEQIAVQRALLEVQENRAADHI